MNHADVRGHEALRYGLFLSSIESLIVKLKAFNVEIVSSVHQSRWLLLEKHIDEAFVSPGGVVLLQLLHGHLAALVGHLIGK